MEIITVGDLKHFLEDNKIPDDTIISVSSERGWFHYEGPKVTYDSSTHKIYITEE